MKDRIDHGDDDDGCVDIATRPSGSAIVRKNIEISSREGFLQITWALINNEIGQRVRAAAATEAGDVSLCCRCTHDRRPNQPPSIALKGRDFCAPSQRVDLMKAEEISRRAIVLRNRIDQNRVNY